MVIGFAGVLWGDDCRGQILPFKAQGLRGSGGLWTRHGGPPTIWGG